MADPTDLPTIAPAAVRFETVTLAEPIVRGGTTIEKIDVRKPKAGELRGGISLQDILTTDVSALLKIIPRVTNPPLTAEEADNLDPVDFAEIGSTIRGFFITKAERAALNAMIAEHTPKT